MIPKGIRLNNPGNLEQGTQLWVGEVRPGADPRFCQFDTPAHGIRAIAVTLRTYQNKHKIRTIRQTITRWAPGNENNTAAYIADVCERTKIGADAVISFKDPATMLKIVKAIIWHENGKQPYDESLIIDAIKEKL